jgi:hypothetical protein
MSTTRRFYELEPDVRALQAQADPSRRQSPVEVILREEERMSSYLGDLIPELALDVVHDEVPVAEIAGPALHRTSADDGGRGTSRGSDQDSYRDEIKIGETEIREIKRLGDRKAHAREGDEIRDEVQKRRREHASCETRRLPVGIQHARETVEATTGIEPVYTALQAAA